MPDYRSYGGQGPLILGVTWSFCTVTSFLAVLRTLSAAPKPGAQRWWELRWDYIWFILSYVLAVAAQIILTISVLYGLGNHVEDVGYDDGAIAALYNWTSEMIIIVDIGLAKVAIIAFIHTLQGPTHPRLKWILHFIWITNTIVNINQIMLILLQCKPLAAFWDYRIAGADCSFAQTTSKVGFFQGAWGAATDIALALYPVFLYWSLQMSWKLKLGLFALTGGGLIVGAAAVLKTMYIRVILVTDDVTWAFADLVIWLFVEIWLVLILSSIPPLRPLFVRTYRKTSTVVTSSKNRTRDAFNDRSRDRADQDDMQLKLYPGSTGGYKADAAKAQQGLDKTGGRRASAGARELNLIDGNDSQESILPGHIWARTDTSVRRDPASRSNSKSETIA